MKIIVKDLIFISSLILLLVAALPAYSLLIEGPKVCNNERTAICNSEIDTESTSDTPILKGCIQCGVEICPDGNPSRESNKCEQPATGEARCVKRQVCPQAVQTRPTAIIGFEVFEKLPIIAKASPEVLVFSSPQTGSYVVSVKNSNPTEVKLGIGVEIPKGWQKNHVAQITIPPSDTRSFELHISPETNVAQGDYKISIALFDFQYKIKGSTFVTYKITERGIPTIEVNPVSVTVVPQEEASFNVSITNTDIEGFNSTSFRLSIEKPLGWSSRIIPDSATGYKLEPAETRTVEVRIKSNKTPEQGPNRIGIKVIRSKEEFQNSAIVSITLCGDGICQLGEEIDSTKSCTKDCIDKNYLCNFPTPPSYGSGKRCERDGDIEDWGVQFSGVLLKGNPLSFRVCNYGSTIEQCNSVSTINCGIDSSCICSTDESEIFVNRCKSACVDKKGTYYLLTRTVDGQSVVSANYSYECPFVNLPEIVGLRENLLLARTNYDISAAAFKDKIKTANETVKSTILPCLSALDLIVTRHNDAVSIFDGVLALPGKKNTSEAKRMFNDLSAETGLLFNKHCRLSKGIMLIDRVNTPDIIAEDETLHIAVDIRNTGTTEYYGYVECDFIDRSNKKTTERSECSGPIQADEIRGVVVSKNNLIEGDLRMQCRVIGSLASNCPSSSSEQHDQIDVIALNVVSKDIFVRSVSGTYKDDQAFCSVRTSQNAGCVSCTLGDKSCRKIGTSVNETTDFVCPIEQDKFGPYDLNGSVFFTTSCNPVDPSSKSSTLHVPGCPDGRLQSGEQCDDGNQINDDGCTNDCKLPVCGDAIIQNKTKEECDTFNFGGKSCENLGFTGGTLGCISCKINTTTCTKVQIPVNKCGNNQLDQDLGEQCDGNKFGNNTCQTFGFSSGTLGCASCIINTTNCIKIPINKCGNNQIDQDLGEQCDGNKFGNNTCQTFGFSSGTLGCASCIINTTTCIQVANKCGNNVKDRGEECDPPNTESEQCGQTELECDGKRTKRRSDVGFCSSSCTCQTTEFVSGCEKDSCRASCSDGDTQTRVVKGITVTDFCNANCEWVEGKPEIGFYFDPIYADGTLKSETITYNAILENIGASSEKYAFRVESGDATIEIDGRSLTEIEVPAGKKSFVTLIVKPSTNVLGNLDIVNLSIQNSKGIRKSASFRTIISTVANRPPETTLIESSPRVVDEGGVIKFNTNIADPNGDNIDKAFICKDPQCSVVAGDVYCALQFSKNYGCSYSTVTPGTFSYHVVAYDNNGAKTVSDIRTFQVNVKPKTPKVECTVDTDCKSNKKCFENKCREKIPEPKVLPLIPIFVVLLVAAASFLIIRRRLDETRRLLIVISTAAGTIIAFLLELPLVAVSLVIIAIIILFYLRLREE